jgi:50S ribosome-binding GTPase
MTEGQGTSAKPVPGSGIGGAVVPGPGPSDASAPPGIPDAAGIHDPPGIPELPGIPGVGGPRATGGGPRKAAHGAGAHAGGTNLAGALGGGAYGPGAHAGGAHEVGAHAAGSPPDRPPPMGARPGAHAGPVLGSAHDPASTPPPGPASAGQASAGPAPADLAPADLARDDPARDDLTAAPTEPYVKVDARRLETALLGLRNPIVTVPLLLEAPGVAEARAERRKLLSQIDDYLLPRLRQSGAPIMVALVGSTGAGKSTLMNSLVGKQVSQTGIRRPTTNSPVLACHPADAHWFAENVFLPTLPRVRQQGLAMPGRDGLLVLAASEGMPRGVALLDTPDIDSVVQAHRDFAHQFLDASDLWLFMTSARRYADAAVWELLQDARDRGAALAVVLSRVPPSSAQQLGSHFEAMLEANGLTDLRRFLIAETIVNNAMLPAEVARPVREWLEETATGDDRRVAVLTQTMSGMLDTFRIRIPVLASQAATQLTLRGELRASVRGAYDDGLADFDSGVSDGSLLRGEVLARWQDFAGTGDLMRTLQVRRGRASASRPKKKRRLPARAGALRAAIRASLESLVVATADRAAEHAVVGWQQQPAGAALLSELAAAAEAGPSAASDYLALALVDLGMADSVASEDDAMPVDAAALGRSSPELAAAARRVIRSWQDRMLQLVEAEKVTKRSIARVVSFDHESLALVLMVAVLGTGSPSASSDAAGTAAAADGGQMASAGVPGPDAVSGPGTGPERLLSSLFGAGLLRDITAAARQDLHERVAVLLDAELGRFTEVIDAAGEPDETVAARLVQAGEALEAVR